MTSSLCVSICKETLIDWQMGQKAHCPALCLCHCSPNSLVILDYNCLNCVIILHLPCSVSSFYKTERKLPNWKPSNFRGRNKSLNMYPKINIFLKYNHLRSLVIKAVHQNSRKWHHWAIKPKMGLERGRYWPYTSVLIHWVKMFSIALRYAL